MNSGKQQRRRVAVVGTGISGLAAAWLLRETADVTVFEAETRPGGHSCTVLVDAESTGKAAAAPGTVPHLGPTSVRSIPVDVGFIVYNEATYPNLTALFAHLDIATEATDMSLAVSLAGGDFEYAGGYFSQLFAQPRNVLRPRFWQMMRDIIRFYRHARRDIDSLTSSGISLGAYLDQKRYSAAFKRDHLQPMAAAIWSIPTAQVLDYPAHAFIRFHDNHGLLNLVNRPIWRTVRGGSRVYVDKMCARLGDRLRLGQRVVSVEPLDTGVQVAVASGAAEIFDDVVIATHSDQALALRPSPSPRERALLGAIRYQANHAVLHSDAGLMPRRRKAWASWNYIGADDGADAGTETDEHARVTVTYWMNKLQNLGDAPPLFVTLNPNHAIDPACIHAAFEFAHPVIDAAAIAAQQQLWSLQGGQGIWYCGAYFGAGFHEDGLQASLAVAEAISGRKRPWQVAGESDRIVLTSSEPSRAYGASEAMPGTLENHGQNNGQEGVPNRMLDHGPDKGGDTATHQDGSVAPKAAALTRPAEVSG